MNDTVVWLDHIWSSATETEEWTIESLIKIMRNIKQLYATLFTSRVTLHFLNQDIDGAITTVQNECGTDTISRICSAGDKHVEHPVVLAITWMHRTLWFIATLIQLECRDTRCVDNVRKAYHTTLRKYHSWTTRTSFASVLALCSPDLSTIQQLIASHPDRIQRLSVLFIRHHLRCQQQLVKLGLHNERLF